ncbi:ArnT family glycosyltransferase [Pseudonocardia sp. Cha107L01]|uniref:ArnT family glycosyltransferase n=1 Tax=Pseudonocardia sp. Cha107L01 TaxID=3457576 RepID=UPI00403E5D1A
MSAGIAAPVVEAATRPRRRAFDLIRERSAELIIIAAVLVRVPLVFLPITYREDIWRQADTASIARNFLTDPNILFPRINWGGAGPGYVESEFPLYPWMVSLLYRIFGEHVWLGRAVALVASAVTLWLFWRLADRVLTRRATLFALAFFAVSPLFLRLSVAYMPEATTMTAYLGSLLLFDRWLTDRRWSTALSCGAVTALAGLLKPTALNVGILFVILLLVRRESRRLLSGQAVALAVIALVPVGAWLWHGAALHAEFGNTFGVISGGDNKFGSLKYWISPRFYLGTAKLEMIWVYAVGALPLAIIGIIVAVRRRGPWLVLSGFLAIAVYFLVVARPAESTFGLQYHVFAIPYAALAVGLGADWLVGLQKMRTAGPVRLARAAAALLAALTVVGTAHIYADEFRDYGAQTIACGNAIRETVPPDDLVIVTSSEPRSIEGEPNNYQDPTLFFHGNRRGWSLPTDQEDPSSVEGYRQSGARWLIIGSRAQVLSSPRFEAYVAGFPQRGPGGDAECGIYDLRP